MVRFVDNLSIAKRHALHSKVWAVVKANAYGHGLSRVLDGFSDADGLAMLDLNEAITVRQLGWRKPMLLLEGLFEPCDLAVASEFVLTLVVHRWSQIAMMQSATKGVAEGCSEAFVSIPSPA